MGRDKLKRTGNTGQNKSPYGFEDLACGPRPHTKTSSKVFANDNFLFVAAGHITMICELEPLSAVVALGHIIPCGLQPQDGLAPQKSFVVALGPTVALGHRLFYF